MFAHTIIIFKIISTMVWCRKFLLCEESKIIFKTWINKINSSILFLENNSAKNGCLHGQIM